MADVVQWLLQGHAGFTAVDYGLTFVLALMGASTAALVINPKITLPKRNRNELDLGFFRLLIIGTFAGLAIGHKAPVPYFVGCSAPILVPIVLRKLLPALLEALRPILLALLDAYAAKKDNK